MPRESVIILGIPVDNLSLPEAVERIFLMIDDYRRDGVPRQVATVNVDFIVNTLSWGWGGIRHPELLDILRRADLVTADGMPVVWLSRLLGCPLRERVTGADLVPALAAESARRGASLFFLGGRDDVGQRAADLLVRRNPGLTVAGVSAPFVYTEGERLADFDAEDEAIVAEINDSQPDILLIAFGNPKQELWFARNAPRLKAPVTIGIGGTFEFIVGTVSRAPLWVQKGGLEWIYRIMMDPRRLWKRYAVGLLKFTLHAWPAIRISRAGRAGQGSGVPAATGEAPGLQRLEEGVCTVTLPARFTALAARELEQAIERVRRPGDAVILDFAQVEEIDAAGLGFLVRLWCQVLKTGGELIPISLNDHLRDFLRFNRVADIIREHPFNDRNSALEYIHARRSCGSSPYRLSFLSDGTAVIALRGRLDALAMKNFSFDGLLPRLENRDCILDLTTLEFVDSSGLVAFARIQRHVRKFGKGCTLCAPNELVRQLLRLTRFDRLFSMTDDRSILAGGALYAKRE